jgi:aminoglycoside phosphotransferase family enzyme/predicted kinase
MTAGSPDPGRLAQGMGEPPPGEPYAATAETHTSTVLFAGGLAFKVKKPVRLAFLDLSRRDYREANCHAEVELNRRIAPDVYLGVAELPRVAAVASGRPADEGEPVVVMRRMPVARKLSSLIAAGENVGGALHAVARQVAVMHAREEPVHGFDLPGTMRSLWRAGREQLVPFQDRLLPVGELDEVAALAEEYLGGRVGMLRQREDRGHVRDGHGDLLTDDIFCLDDGPRILDCLEFDVGLRLGDLLNDVAFLAMDLQAHGRTDLAEVFLQGYHEFTDEDAPRSLVDHYVAYRAFVRAKVECLRHAQGDDTAAGRARSMLGLCQEQLRAARVHLVLVGGVPGSGKSVLSRSLVEGDPGAREWSLLSSDVVRKELAGVSPLTSCRAPVGAGLYDREHTAATYAELLRRARLALERGVSVVVDASWTSEEDRAAARRLAATTRAALTEVECRADPDTCRRRLAERTGPHPSDAYPLVLEHLSAMAAPWPQALAVSTEGPKGQAAERVRAALETTRIPGPARD